MVHPAFAAHQRARWLRNDAAVWVRPDAVKFLKPGSDPADVYPALAPRRDARLRADARAVDDGIASERAVLDNLRADLAQIKHDLVWQRLESDVSQKYSDSQPRVPSGSGRESGRWTIGSSGRPRVYISGSNPKDEGAGDGEPLDENVDGSDDNPGFDGATDNFDTGDGSLDSNSIGHRTDADRQQIGITDIRVVSDADPEVVRPGEQYAANGHHKMPQSIFNNWDLPQETRRIFDADTTGRLLGQTIVRLSPEGVPISHSWNEAHREYNKAVGQLSDDFLSRNNLLPRDMNPSQAQDLLGEIKRSEDPRIRDFNRAMNMLRRVFQFRSGRSE